MSEQQQKVVIVVRADGAEKAGRDIEKIGTASKKTSKDMNAMTDAVKRFVSIYASIWSLRKVAGFMDDWIAVQNRIKLTTNSLEEFASVYKSVGRIARDTRTDIVATAMAYNRAAMSSEALGLSADKLNSVVSTVNKTLKISGSTAQESRASLIQFFQGMASGQLRGEEFRSVTEANMRLTKLLKDELSGGDLGKLREMAFAGQLTAEKALNAILKQAQRIDKEFKNINPSIADGFTIISNSLVDMMGKFNTATGFTTKLYSAMGFLADNLNTVAALITLLAVSYIPALIRKLSFLATFTLTNPILAGLALGLAGVMLIINKINADKARIEAFDDTSLKNIEKGKKILEDTRKELFKLQDAYMNLSFFGGKAERMILNDRIKETKESIKGLNDAIKYGLDPSPFNMLASSVDFTTKSVSQLVAEMNKLTSGTKGTTIMSLVGKYGFQTSSGSEFVNPTGMANLIPGASDYLKEQGLLTGKLTDETGKLNEELLKQVAIHDKNFKIVMNYKGGIGDIGAAQEKITKLMDKWMSNWRNVLDPTEALNLYNVFVLLNQQLFETGKKVKDLKDDWYLVGEGVKFRPEMIPRTENYSTIFTPSSYSEWEKIKGGIEAGMIQFADKYSSIVENIAGITNNFFESFSTGISDSMIGLIDGTIEKWSQFGEFWKNLMHNIAKEAFAALTKMLMFQYVLAPLMPGYGKSGSFMGFDTGLSNQSSDISTLLSGLGTGLGMFKEEGGSVNANQPYIVGEKRPELFVPRTSGTIVPDLSNIGSGGTTVQNYVVLDSDLPNIMAKSDANKKEIMNQISLNKKRIKSMLGVN